jgi:hypothetical protein
VKTEPEWEDGAEECDYCWERAVYERWDDDGERWVYCGAHAPDDARPIRVDTDGYPIRTPPRAEGG